MRVSLQLKGEKIEKLVAIGVCLLNEQHVIIPQNPINGIEASTCSMVSLVHNKGVQSELLKEIFMNRMLCITLAALSLSIVPCRAGVWDVVSHELLSTPAQQSSLDNSTIINGLKEALATGTERAVTEVAKTDGYFGNQQIKILLPDKIQKVTNILGSVGYQQQVDAFVLSMNRAAEKAAPQAAKLFGDAIRQMTVEDANGILNGTETAATQYFEKKTRTQLFDAFKPVVSKSMGEVGTVQTYKEMLGKYQSLPLASMAGIPSLDLDSYIVNKALDGLFFMVKTEEKNIRSNPAAQTTDLLRQVFAK